MDRRTATRVGTYHANEGRLEFFNDSVPEHVPASVLADMRMYAEIEIKAKG